MPKKLKYTESEIFYTHVPQIGALNCILCSAMDPHHHYVEKPTIEEIIMKYLNDKDVVELIKKYGSNDKTPNPSNANS